MSEVDTDGSGPGGDDAGDEPLGTAMDAEFDTVAAWTADVALDLGPPFHLPAGCRGSGSPTTLDWLCDALTLGPADRMLDCGAGVGGPAAYATARTGVRPVLSEPEHGACVAAARLFGAPVVQAGTDLPFATGAFDVAWALGVLCTVGEQDRFLVELARVLRPGGRLGLLVFVAQRPQLSEQPEGNHFPDQATLRRLLTGAGFDVQTLRDDDVGTDPADWTERSAAVETELGRRHGDDPAWQVAADQAAIMGRLLAGGEIAGTLVVARTVAH